MSKTKGTALLLEQMRILEEIVKEKGEKVADFSLALALSEASNEDVLPCDARNTRKNINTMMNIDLNLRETAEILTEGQEKIASILISEHNQEIDS